MLDFVSLSNERYTAKHYDPSRIISKEDLEFR